MKRHKFVSQKFAKALDSNLSGLPLKKVTDSISFRLVLQLTAGTENEIYIYVVLLIKVSSSSMFADV